MMHLKQACVYVQRSMRWRGGYYAYDPKPLKLAVLLAILQVSGFYTLLFSLNDNGNA